jgi:hypothetical protein
MICKNENHFPVSDMIPPLRGGFFCPAGARVMSPLRGVVVCDASDISETFQTSQAPQAIQTIQAPKTFQTPQTFQTTLHPQTSHSLLKTKHYLNRIILIFSI